MSDSDTASRRFGFSTGALERGDFVTATSWMRDHDVRTIELSALRFDELEPLVSSLDLIDLHSFEYVSFHAPSYFSVEQEAQVIELLQPVRARNWNIVVHPDVIFTPRQWECFGSCLLIENMDRRKPVGRTADELSSYFEKLPEARFCLDVAHARQIDSTLSMVMEMIESFGDRIAEVHISELDSRCRHVPMTNSAVNDYQRFAPWIGPDIPVIIESMLDRNMAGVRLEEFDLARRAMAYCEPVTWNEARVASGFETLNVSLPCQEQKAWLHHT